MESSLEEAEAGAGIPVWRLLQHPTKRDMDEIWKCYFFLRGVGKGLFLFLFFVERTGFGDLLAPEGKKG